MDVDVDMFDDPLEEESTIFDAFYDDKSLGICLIYTVLIFISFIQLAFIYYNYHNKENKISKIKVLEVTFLFFCGVSAVYSINWLKELIFYPSVELPDIIGIFLFNCFIIIGIIFCELIAETKYYFKTSFEDYYWSCCSIWFILSFAWAILHSNIGKFLYTSILKLILGLHLSFFLILFFLLLTDTVFRYLKSRNIIV